MTDKPKHSPAPWVINGSKISDTEGIRVCETYWRTENYTNTHIISAAPEMLEALELVVKDYESITGFDVKNTTIEKIRNAIRKAKGE